jgi:hypothetical protein
VEVNTMPYPGYTTDEVGRRGRELYEKKIRAQVEPAHTGKFLVLDIVTGDYEIAEDDLTASDRLLARNPHAVLYGLRIGSPTTYRLGGHSLGVRP